jgi:hypothetical protein
MSHIVNIGDELNESLEVTTFSLRCTHLFLLSRALFLNALPLLSKTAAMMHALERQ